MGDIVTRPSEISNTSSMLEGVASNDLIEVHLSMRPLPMGGFCKKRNVKQPPLPSLAKNSLLALITRSRGIITANEQDKLRSRRKRVE